MLPPILQLASVTKRFGGVEALAETTLDVATGRTTVLLGPSGCGKTTALRLMLGLVRPDGGQVLFRQRALDPEALRAARTQMGYVVQDGGLFPHLTALDNVRLMARHLRWPDARIRARVAELAALVRLADDALARFPGELSGGQRQRVALMRALMLEPELLFLDEPLGALDPLVRADLQDDLAGIFRRLEKSVVLVTHDLAEAALFGDVLVLMQDGHIAQRGTLDDLVARPASPFVTRFVRAQRRLDVDVKA
ncbi:MAG TPA: ATP-binding cassette domain-containing protein [Polyangia bacterium]|nr:ATP-binding cassette domain-containing protein [Polyangia bacterium]